jgi:hypothetical protein
MTNDTDHSFCYDMEAMLPFQKDLMSNLSGGIAPSELMVYTAGRQTGKSMYYQYAQQWEDMFSQKPLFEVVDSALVDGEQWHTVAVSSPIATWVRTKKKDQWSEHPVRGSRFRSVFDMNEKLYTMLGMKFS